MAHGKLRTEKNCLNCNAQVDGRFCSVCGQENIEPKETFWQLVSHFVYDLFHYDGKILSSLKYLLFKPGLLTHEYVRGRRTSFLHPIRLYIFISAVFFIIFISFIVGSEKSSHDNPNALTSVQQGAIQKSIDQLTDTLDKISDSAEKIKFIHEITALKQLPGFYAQKDRLSFLPANAKLDSADIAAIDSSNIAIGSDELPKTLKAYEANQQKLPKEKRDGWLMRSINKHTIAINEKYRYNKGEFWDATKEHFFHLLPTMMFISLPIVALIFSLLYIRRKQFSYVQHGVFVLHIYSAVFVFSLIIYALGGINNYLHWRLLSFLISVGIIFIFFYVYKAMRNFYEQGRAKTILKYIIFVSAYFVVLLLLMLIFLLTSLIQV